MELLLAHLLTNLGLSASSRQALSDLPVSAARTLDRTRRLHWRGPSTETGYVLETAAATDGPWKPAPFAPVIANGRTVVSMPANVEHLLPAPPTVRRAAQSGTKNWQGGTVTL